MFLTAHISLAVLRNTFLQVPHQLTGTTRKQNGEHLTFPKFVETLSISYITADGAFHSDNLDLSEIQNLLLDQTENEKAITNSNDKNKF